MSVVDLSYSQTGSGSPVVLLHALPLSSALFGPLSELPGYRLITPDLRGFGASPLGSAEPSLDLMAADVVALLDGLGIDRAIVGGVSMGGYVTMELCRQAPERLSGVVLLDTKAGADTEPARAARLSMAAAVLERGRYMLDPMMAGLLGETSRQSRPDVVATVSGWLDDADPAAVAWAQRAMAARPGSFDTLRECHLPGVVVVGEEDTLSPVTEAEAMAQALGTVARVIPRTGHLAVLEDPATTRDVLVAALVASVT